MGLFFLRKTNSGGRGLFLLRTTNSEGRGCFSDGKQTLGGGVCFSYGQQTLRGGVCFSDEQQTLGGGKKLVKGGSSGLLHQMLPTLLVLSFHNSLTSSFFAITLFVFFPSFSIPLSPSSFSFSPSPHPFFPRGF